MKTRFESLRTTILRSLSLVEALIDFGEEEVEDHVYDEGRLIYHLTVHDSCISVSKDSGPPDIPNNSVASLRL